MLERFHRDVLRYLPAQVVPAGVGLLSVLVLTRILSRQDFGLLTLITATVDGGRLLLSWLPAAVVRYYPATRDGRRAELIRTAVWGQTVLAVVIAGVAALVAAALPGDPRYRWLVPLGLGIFAVRAVAHLLAQLLRARLEPAAYSGFVIWQSAAGLALGATLAGVWGLATEGVLGGYLLADLAALPWLWRRALAGAAVSGAPSRSALGEMARYGLPLVPNRFGSWAVRRFDRYQIHAVYGADAVGVYSAAYVIAQHTVQLLSSAMRLPSWPLLAGIWESGDPEAGKRFLTSMTRLYLLLALPMVVGLSVLARPVMQLLTRPEYAEAWRVMPWVAGGVLLLGLQQGFTQSLQLVDRTPVLMQSMIAAAMVNVTLNWWLLPIFGYPIAALTTFAAYLLLCLWRGIASHRFCRWPFPWRSAWRDLGAAGAMGVAVALSGRALGGQPPIVVLAVCIPLGVAVYGLLSWLSGELRSIRAASRR